MQSWQNVLFVKRELTLETNVKSVRVKTEGGATKKMYVCTSCLKSGRVERA